MKKGETSHTENQMKSLLLHVAHTEKPKGEDGDGLNSLSMER